MQFWPLFGLTKRLTENKSYDSPVEPPRLPLRIFSHSLFVFIVDVGSSNALNFEISALESPQYNIHRFGIYLTDSPRHADVLLVLGRPTEAMLGPLQETIAQLPEPFCIVTIDDCPGDQPGDPYPPLPNNICSLQGVPSPDQLLGLLLDLSIPKRKKT